MTSPEPRIPPRERTDRTALSPHGGGGRNEGAAALRVLITDEDLDSRVTTRRAVQRVPLEVAGEVGYGAAAVSLALSTLPDLILLAVEEPVGRPLETAEALANALPDTPIVIYSSLNDAEAVRRAMVFGARDYLVKPVQVARLLEAVETVRVQQERHRLRRGGLHLDTAGRGTVVTIIGAKGGIGKSVLAVNLAVALRRETGRTVAIFDADTDFGDVATMLDLTPTMTLEDLIPHLHRVDREGIRGYLTEHSTGVEVLAAPADGEVWEECDSSGVSRIVDLLAQNFDYVVIDTRGALDRVVRACIEGSTLTLIVTTGEVSSIRDTATALRRLVAWNIDEDRLKILLNRGQAVNGFRLEDLREAFDQEIFWQLPADRRVPASIQTGQPVVLEASSAVGRSVSELARRIAGTRSSLLALQPPRPLWKRLLRLE